MLSHSDIDDIKALLNDKSQYGYNDVTYTRVGTTTTGDATIGMANTANLTVDDIVNGTGIPADSVIVEVGTSYIELDELATATSTAGVDLTIAHYADAEFEAAITAVEAEVKLNEIWPYTTEDYYNTVNALASLEDRYNDQYLVYAERYFIAGYFLKQNALLELSGRLALKLFTVDANGVGGATSGPSGKQYLSTEYILKGRDYMRKAGYNTTVQIGIHAAQPKRYGYTL